jgi:DNA-binding NarL/FixJ family response regulator
MLKIVVADNQAIFRAGIAKVLAVEDDMRVVAQAPTVGQTRMALEKFRANILVLSANFLSEDAGIRTIATQLATKLIVLAENGDNPQRFLPLGVDAVLFRCVTGEVLLDCVRRVAAGQTFVHDLKQTGNVVEVDDFVGARVRDRLTPKELRIVALIVQGFKNKEIATQLGTTEQVVKNYLRNVYDKIGVSDRLELALFTIHHRILAEAAAATATATVTAIRPQ